MVDYQKALAQVHEFAKNLDALKWPGVESLHDWVTSAPKIWLTKKRESALDWTRNQFSLGKTIPSKSRTSSRAKPTIGLGVPQIAERVEKRMVAREEKENIITTGTAVTQDWDAAWESDGETKEDNSSEGRNRHSLDEERKASEVFSESTIFCINQAQYFTVAKAVNLVNMLFLITPLLASRLLGAKTFASYSCISRSTH